MLKRHDVIAFIATVQPERAKFFYGQTLGLPLIADTPVALVFDAGGAMLRISKVEELTPPPYTVLGWGVPDIHSAIEDLNASGATFEHYQNLSQDEKGVWTTPDGDNVAWFKDPDGNTLSLTQFKS